MLPSLNARARPKNRCRLSIQGLIQTRCQDHTITTVTPHHNPTAWPLHTGKTARSDRGATWSRCVFVTQPSVSLRLFLKHGAFWDVHSPPAPEHSPDWLFGSLVLNLDPNTPSCFTLHHCSGSHQVRGKTWCLTPPSGRCWRWRWAIWAELQRTLVPGHWWLSGSSTSGWSAASPQLHKSVIEQLEAATCHSLTDSPTGPSSYQLVSGAGRYC